MSSTLSFLNKFAPFISLIALLISLIAVVVCALSGHFSYLQNRNDEKEVHTGSSGYYENVFGKIPNNLIDDVSLQDTLTLGNDVVQAIGGRQNISEELAHKADTFRTQVGALHLKIFRDIDRDKRAANLIAGNFFKCLWESIVARKYTPAKYYKILYTQNGFDALIMQLANLPISQRWGFSSAREHANKIWPCLDNLRRAENEYRSAAVTVIQIGVGIGGMVIGFIGLLVSIIITLMN
jgi:hypothetical protein